MYFLLLDLFIFRDKISKSFTNHKSKSYFSYVCNDFRGAENTFHETIHPKLEKKIFLFKGIKRFISNNMKKHLYIFWFSFLKYFLR